MIEEALKKSSLDIQKTVNKTLEERMTKKDSDIEQMSQTLEQKLQQEINALNQVLKKLS